MASAPSTAARSAVIFIFSLVFFVCCGWVLSCLAASVVTGSRGQAGILCNRVAFSKKKDRHRKHEPAEPGPAMRV